MAKYAKRTQANRRSIPVPESTRAEILRLSAQPFKLSAAKIAVQLGISERTVHRVRAAGKAIATSPDPRPVEYVEDEEMKAVGAAYWAWRAYADDYLPIPEDVLDNVVWAMKTFFLRFAGYDYMADIHEDWCRQYFAFERLLLNVPPRHAKSEIITVWLTIFETAMDRNLQTLVISETEKLAKKFTNKIAWHLEFNKPLIAIFGRFRPADTQTPWRPLQGELMIEGRTRSTESGDLTLQVRGAGQQILGMEADRIKCDDIVGRESSFSEATRDKLSEYYHGDVLSRQSPIARVANIGQRIHFLDLYGEIREEKVDFGEHEGEPLYHSINYPAIIDYEKEIVLWPQLWPFEKLMRRRNELKRRSNSWLWDTMYQQNPIPPEGRLVHEEWIFGTDGHPGCLDKERPGGLSIAEWDVQDPSEKDRWIRVMSLDPSPEKQAGLIVADVYADRDVFRCGIIEATRKRMDVRGMNAELDRAWKLYRPSYLVFEQNAAQRWFLQDRDFLAWRDKTGIRVEKHTTGRHKTDPIFGIQSLAVAFEYGRIRLPWGDARGRNMSKVLIEEAITYPYGPYSDLLMALWFIAFNQSRFTLPSAPSTEPDRRGGFPTPAYIGGWAAFER